MSATEQPRASLDHFTGRRVESVQGEDSAWSITLEGGIVISNKDEEKDEAPEGIEGQVLLFVALSELDTRIQFGQVDNNGNVVNETWVTLAPTKYTIGGLEGQTEEFYPQMPEELMDILPPDPSPERVVDAPLEAPESDGEATDAQE
jgi:hypothetical protein